MKNIHRLFTDHATVILTHDRERKEEPSTLKLKTIISHCILISHFYGIKAKEKDKNIEYIFSFSRKKSNQEIIFITTG